MQGASDKMKAGADDLSQFDESARFITVFARTTQKYGGYSYETELSLLRIIKKMGLHGEILATPNVMEIALWQEDRNRQTFHLAVTRDTSYDLTKLGQVNDIVEKVINGQVSMRQGLETLSEIDRSTPRYRNMVNALAFVLCGLGFAAIIGVSWLDMLFGGLLGLISYGFVLVASRSARVSIVMELLAAGIAGVAASVIAVALPGLNPLAMTLCAVIWFVPGYGLTLAPREIIYGNTLSGLIYLTNALVAALKLFAGALMGIAISGILLPPPVRGTLTTIGPVWAWVFVPMLVVGLAILFRVTPKNLALVMVGGWLVWAGVQVGNAIGFWQGTFLGAIILTIFAKISATRLKIPSATVLLPGIMLLVPGYAFLSALYILRLQGLAEGLTALSAVIVTIVAIIAGVFIGDAIASADLSKFRRSRK